MNYLETRLQYLERTVDELLRDYTDLLQRLQRLEQSQWASGSYAGSGGGGGSGFYVAYPTGSVSGATWSFSGSTVTAITPETFSAQVLMVSYDPSGSTTTVQSLGSQTCVNWLKASLVADQGIVVYPDGQGSYGTASQSCV